MFKTKITLKIPPEVLNALSRESLERNVVEDATRAVARLVRDNFRRLDRERTVHGSHFYEEKGVNATRSEIRGNRGVVVVDSYEMAHKLYGGKVRPVRTKFLAIPAAEPFFNRAPRQFGKGENSPLRFRKTRKGGLLYDVRNPAQVAYWLVREVKHRPRPETLPKKSAITKTAKQAASDYLSTI